MRAHEEPFVGKGGGFVSNNEKQHHAIGNNDDTIKHNFCPDKRSAHQPFGHEDRLMNHQFEKNVEAAGFAKEPLPIVGSKLP